MIPRILVTSVLLLATLAQPLAAATPLSPVPPQAQLRVATVQVRVAPDHRDWTYKLGEPVRFKIAVVADNTPLDNATVTYSVGPR